MSQVVYNTVKRLITSPDYTKSDRITMESDSTDRANRGVTPIGWLIAVSFSVLVWYSVFYSVFN